MSIPVGSRLHKGFHEAGHIEVAYLWGATVTEAGIDPTGEGRTRVMHKPDLSTRKPVACGGYAVEVLLFESGRLVGEDGSPLSRAAFDGQAMQNARVDKCPFYLTQPRDPSGFYPGSSFQPCADGTWPPESDGPFITYSMEHIVPKLRSRLLVIEALALELSVYGPLTQEDIESIRLDMSDAP